MSYKCWNKSCPCNFWDGAYGVCELAPTCDRTGSNDLGNATGEHRQKESDLVNTANREVI